MKKFMSIMLGLTLVVGSATLVFGQGKEPEGKEQGKGKKGKGGKGGKEGKEGKEGKNITR